MNKKDVRIMRTEKKKSVVNVVAVEIHFSQ